MNKVEIGLAIALVGMLLFIGVSLYYEMVVEIENNPEIKDIGGPPAITDLRLLVLIVSILPTTIFIILKFNSVEEEKEEK